MRDEGGRVGAVVSAEVLAYESGKGVGRVDSVAAEEPLEIRLLLGGETRTIAITMRTPGADFELATGFLFGEGVISSGADVAGISYCVDRPIGEEQRYNIVNVRLAPGVRPDLRPLERHFFTSSACGVCGKATLEALALRSQPLGEGLIVDPELLLGLPDKLRSAQGVFEATGGLHAAGLFDSRGGLVALREDVGRHNALDKLIGWSLLQGLTPLSESVLVVSGRASYELLQKALVAGVPIVCAVSAPSSLAMAVAQEFGMTLVGFLRGNRFNVYSGQSRLDPPLLVADRAKARPTTGR
ncbi:MAG: formate dehydrogenase accessory sulfurtransferase FdhD [Actinomycetota bacterium]|nr:formate dehydrogenase accessory sulfurtransferase FdhD [Actinomycetota bacterium]